MKQWSPLAKIYVAHRHLSLAISARGYQISLEVCALGYGMLRHHLKVHICAGATSLLLQGCLSLWRARSWPDYGSWCQGASQPLLSRQTLTFLLWASGMGCWAQPVLLLYAMLGSISPNPQPSVVVAKHCGKMYGNEEGRLSFHYTAKAYGTQGEYFITSSGSIRRSHYTAWVDI